jgi:type I restriction enzyme, S subunit
MLGAMTRPPASGKADAVRRKRRQALVEIDAILHSTFLSMFGDPVTNPKDWEQATIEKCLVEIQAGWSAKGADRPAKDDEYGVLKISAVTSGAYLPEENKAVTDIPPGVELVKPRKGDLLFSRANTRELVAATCLVDRTTENRFLPDKLWRLVPNPKTAKPEYIRFVLAHNEYRARLCAKATGTSGSMLNISQSKLLQHPIPLPDIGIQLGFSRIHTRLSDARERQVSALNSSENFFASLSYNAFRGHL